MAKFLFPKKNIFNSDSYKEFLILDERESHYINVDIESLIKEKEVLVSFDLFVFIEALRESHLPLESTLIDVSQLFKLVIGKPSKEMKSSSPFSLNSIFQYYKIYPTDRIDEIFKNLHTRINLITDDQVIDILKGLRTVFNNLVNDLKERNEYKRFFEVELPITKILLNRELQGIRISKEKFHSRINQLDEIEILSRNQLRYHYNIIDGNDKDSISEALKNNNLRNLTDRVYTENFEHLLKVGSEYNELLSLLYYSRKAKRDKSFMYNFSISDGDRIYPTFDSIGTITSRIMIKQPLIQHLRKSSRDIFLPDNQMKFIYADFGQFEPGILADKSNDKGMISQYNSGDIYEGLSKILFGDSSSRRLSKLLFLSYMYGMSMETLSNTISALIPSSDNEMQTRIELFFSEFMQLKTFKKGLEIELLSNNRIGTSNGNFRNRSSHSRKLTSKEKRWILSQKIQGTASLILKMAILDLSKYQFIEFLIPMHDAVLFQVPSSMYKKSKSLIEEAFRKAFKNECPKINPKVTFESFHG